MILVTGNSGNWKSSSKAGDLKSGDSESSDVPIMTVRTPSGYWVRHMAPAYRIRENIIVESQSGLRREWHYLGTLSNGRWKITKFGPWHCSDICGTIELSANA